MMRRRQQGQVKSSETGARDYILIKNILCNRSAMKLLSFECVNGRLQELHLEKSSTFVMFVLSSASDHVLQVSLIDLLDPSLTKICEFTLKDVQGVGKKCWLQLVPLQA